MLGVFFFLDSNFNKQGKNGEKKNDICHLDFPGKVFLIVSFLLTLQLLWLWSFCGTAKFLLVFGPFHSHLPLRGHMISPHVSDSPSSLSLMSTPIQTFLGDADPVSIILSLRFLLSTQHSLMTFINSLVSDSPGPPEYLALKMPLKKKS